MLPMVMKKNIALSLAAGVLLLINGVTAAGPQARKTSPSLDIGEGAVDFRLPGVDGKLYSLKDFEKSRVLCVLFTCNHCPTAQAYETRVKELVRDYAKRGVALVAISPNDAEAVRLDELGYTDLGDSFEDMKLRARHAKFNFPYLYDGRTQRVSRAYGPRATPHVFIFDKSRKLRYSGRIDDDESGGAIRSHDARNAIDALLAGKPVTVPRTRTFGCSIKWSDKREANRRFMEKLAAEKVTLEDLDVEQTKALRANRTEKMRLINVWATWCGPCVTEFPHLVEAYRMYRRRPFEFVSISMDGKDKSGEVLSKLKSFQASNRNYHYGSKDRDALANALDGEWSGALPLTLLVKPGGQIVYRHEGEIEPLKLRREIVKHLGRTYH